MRLWTFTFALTVAALQMFTGQHCSAAVSSEVTTADRFNGPIRSIVTEYCVGCHSTQKHKGDLDLERFSTFDEVLRFPEVWQHVAEQLANNEMPPKEERQPTTVERQQLLGWIDAVLGEVALSRAGDPGPVVLRRLSNAEYTYTIRDLTGVPTLDPGHEFPADSASGEGFMNVGNSLVISPSLVTKYLDAAKEVAGHAMLLPDGIRFSPKNTRRDWTEELLAEIRRMYGEFTDNGGGTSVNLQGIRFDTKDGGVLPLDKYLSALLREREKGQITAAEKIGLSDKYLRKLRETLESNEPSLLLDPIRVRWREAKPGDAAALAKEIAQWQHALWKFNSVGHIGKVGGPRAWMEPIAPPPDKQELLLKVAAGPDRAELARAFDEFREIFPAALCYTKIVPVDEVVTLTLFYREDHQFVRLMLDDAQAARLDRLWDELHFIAQDSLTLVDAFEQLWQYATQDADPTVFEPMREPIKRKAAAFRQRQLEAEPRHLDAVLEFADRAYRRPLTDSESVELRELYRSLRDEELSHDEAIRLTLARVLVAPAFLYRVETPGPGMDQAPVNDWELATRLSYFLWSSVPDDELRRAADEGTLRNPEMLAAQSRRMLCDPRVRRLATEFACAWLQIYDFDELDEKSARHFPTFAELRGSMYEEAIRFFTCLFQNDGSVLDILDADYAFVNAELASHYGIPGIEGVEWERVEGVKKFSRGGVLTQAAVLSKQSGASRTSPILRGNWVAEVLLGEKLPRPPKDVPQLPEEESAETLTVRQLTEKHSSDPRCYGCHQRIDPYGFALEAFDAIGRRREQDFAGRMIDTRTRLMDGAELAGLDGLRNYLLTERRDAFVKQFCRKLLGYALGRGVMLSDGPLISEMCDRLASADYRISAAIDAIVRSKQFREIRGKEVGMKDHSL